MKRVLVIDDELVIRELMQEMLQMGGFESVTLPDGSNALSLQRRYFFDLVITDLLMPVYDGISTIITLRKEFPDLKIIASRYAVILSVCSRTALRDVRIPGYAGSYRSSVCRSV